MNLCFLVMLAAVLLSPTAVSSALGRSETDNGSIALTLRDATDHLQIFTISSDGTNRKQLTYEGDNGRPAWSADGKKMVYSSRNGDRVFVNVMDADGSNQRTLCEGDAPDWSRDMKTIAFSWRSQIWAIDPSGANQRKITNSATTK
jgi:Tol biopolymer transport system component